MIADSWILTDWLSFKDTLLSAFWAYQSDVTFLLDWFLLFYIETLETEFDSSFPSATPFSCFLVSLSSYSTNLPGDVSPNLRVILELYKLYGSSLLWISFWVGMVWILVGTEGETNIFLGRSGLWGFDLSETPYLDRIDSLLKSYFEGLETTLWSCWKVWMLGLGAWFQLNLTRCPASREGLRWAWTRGWDGWR